MSVAEKEGRAGCEEGFAVDDAAFGIELRFLVAEDFYTIDAVDDLVAASDFDFDLHPLVGGEVLGG